MKFTQEERAMIHKLLLVNRNAELCRAAANMMSCSYVSSSLENNLNGQANKFDEEVGEIMVELFDADDFDQVMEDYVDYLDRKS